MLAKIGLLMSVKSLLVCHNEAHIVVLQRILTKYVLENMSTVAALNPPDKEKRLAEIKPARLAQWEATRATQRGVKRGLEPSPAHKKRAHLADLIDTALGAESSGSGGVPKPAAPAPPAATAVPEAKEASEEEEEEDQEDDREEDKGNQNTTPAKKRPGKKQKQAPSATASTQQTAPTANLTEMLKAWA